MFNDLGSVAALSSAIRFADFVDALFDLFPFRFRRVYLRSLPNHVCCIIPFIVPSSPPVCLLMSHQTSALQDFYESGFYTIESSHAPNTLGVNVDFLKLNKRDWQNLPKRVCRPHSAPAKPP